MSYAITHVVPREGFADRLRALLSHDHEARGLVEQESLRSIIFDNLVGQGHARVGVLKERDEAIAAARQAGEQYLHHEKMAKAHELTALKATDQTIKEVAAAEYSRADALRQLAMQKCLELEAIAEEKKAAAVATVPEAWVDHVPGMYSKQIELIVKVAEALIPGVGDRCKMIKVELSGDIMSEPKGDGTLGVRLWPGD